MRRPCDEAWCAVATARRMHGREALRSPSLTPPKTAHFGAIPAVRHVAPATAAIAARVEEEPVAVFATALIHAQQLVRRQQLSR
jgi:hypothetical protein